MKKFDFNIGGFKFGGMVILALVGMLIFALSMPIGIEGKGEVYLDNKLLVDGEGSILGISKVERNFSIENASDTNNSISVDYKGNNFVSVEYKVKAPAWVWIYILEFM